MVIFLQKLTKITVQMVYNLIRRNGQLQSAYRCVKWKDRTRSRTSLCLWDMLVLYVQPKYMLFAVRYRSIVRG